MKDEEAQSTGANPTKKEGSEQSGFFGSRGKYKFWVLAAILLLAFWSMFTGSVTIKWSAGNISRGSDDFDSLIRGDFDILEVEERKKLSRHMWDVYTQSRSIKLPKFWQKAFEAAYEDLTSDDPSVRDAALSEIAKMSFVRSTLMDEFEATPVQSSLRASEKKARL